MTRCSRPWPWSTSGVGELAAGGPVPPDQVAGLAEMAGSQERALRSLILRDPDEERTPAGAASLRAALEALAGAERSLPVTVGASGYLLKSATSAELVDAVVRVRAGEPTFSPSRPPWSWVSSGAWAGPASPA
jgi:hypothetical protein